MTSVMLLIPRRVQLHEADARELIARLESVDDQRAATNAISRLRYAISDNQEQTLTPTEAAAIHAAVDAWLSTDPAIEPTTRDRLEKLKRATSAI
jgi:hypothetical protein